jgi:hypothetical protein
MKLLVIFIVFSLNACMSNPPVNSQPPYQDPEPKEYPKGYFRNPLNIPIQLAANFGELRNNHFHMGLDIRTQQRENLPVHAAADGYISRIKIERYGFGRAIYITHPNGYTTLYAHLNDFYPALNNYIIDKQYADEQWEQEIEFSPEQFPVKKGQFIANSGNTGGSQGPHLHFEIRDTKTGNNLNPLLFGFGLPDNIFPFIYKLYYYDRRYSTYQVGPTAIPITGANGKYSTTNSVVSLSSPRISFGITAEDKLTPAAFRYGIFSASLYIDDSLQSDFKLDNISYDDTRYINGSIDYKTRQSGGNYIQYLSRLPGNHSTIFNDKSKGDVAIADTLIHTARVVVADANGNESILTFKFRYNPTKDLTPVLSANSIPLVPNKANEVKMEDIEAFFSPNAFYDTVPFILKSEKTTDTKVVSNVHTLLNSKVPVHDSFTVKIKTIVPLSDDEKSKVVVQLISNNKTEAVKGTWQGDFMAAKFRDLGIVKLVKDTIPPRVTLGGWANGSSLKNKKSFTIYAKDNLGELESFKVYVDDKWLMFSRKGDAFIHTFDDRVAVGEHLLKVIVKDVAGNVTEKEYRFSR